MSDRNCQNDINNRSNRSESDQSYTDNYAINSEKMVDSLTKNFISARGNLDVLKNYVLIVAGGIVSRFGQPKASEHMFIIMEHMFTDIVTARNQINELVNCVIYNQAAQLKICVDRVIDNIRPKLNELASNNGVPSR